MNTPRCQLLRIPLAPKKVRNEKMLITTPINLSYDDKNPGAPMRPKKIMDDAKSVKKNLFPDIE